MTDSTYESLHFPDSAFTDIYENTLSFGYKNIFYLSNRPLYGFTGAITHAESWENLAYVECCRRFRVGRRICPFILSVAVIGLSCHVMNLIRKSHLITAGSIINFLYSYFMKVIKHSSCGFKSAINHLGCWDNTRKACKSLF